MEPHHFLNPPVVEVVLGVQFAPLANCTSGHLGWFWKGYVGPEWERATDAPPLVDQFETFGKRPWAPPVFEVKLDSAARPRRLQIANRAGDRLIQVQQTQFLYNWQRKDDIYPSFAGVYDEFRIHFGRFQDFVQQAGLGEVVPNQWEVTYVDQVPRGELWQTPADWYRILPGLFGPHPSVEGLSLEAVGGEWHYEIPPARGRLHVAVQRGMTDTEEPAMLLQTTARGPIGKETGLDLDQGLSIGHEVALRSFFRITSAEAQAVWRRRS